jgi:hypothetical protein
VNENIYMITIHEGIDKSKNIIDAGSFSSPAISLISANFNIKNIFLSCLVLQNEISCKEIRSPPETMKTMFRKLWW